MSVYTPDGWVIVKFVFDKTIYKVFGSWSGSYLGSPSWRVNSGISDFEDCGDYINFSGHSGSSYNCHKLSENIRNPYCLSILEESISRSSKAGLPVSIISFDDFKREFKKG